MQEKTKNKLLIAIAVIITVLSVFNLGLMFGQVVYADDDLFADISDDMKIDKDSVDWFKADFFRERLGSTLNPDDDYIFFNTVNYRENYNYIMSYYFCLQDTVVNITESTITWYATGEYFYIYHHGGQGRNGEPSISWNLSQSTYIKGHSLVYDITSDTFYINYVKNTSTGESAAWFMQYFTKEDGSPYVVRNLETNIEELSQDINVITTITPNLSGTVDLNRVIDGTTFKGSSFKIRFENHSNFPVQVRWYARRTGLGRLSTDNLFQYGNLNIKNDCAAMIFQHGNVYTKNMNSQTWFDANLTMSQMKNSEWFSLGTNENNNYKEIEISYTSTSFQPNVSYTWYTEALRTGSYGSVCEVFYSGSTGENPYPTNHAVDIDGLTLCQSDTFQFTSQYTYTYQSSGVGSDASCVGSDEDYLINTYSSSGRSDTVGSEGGDSSYKNLYLDKTSWLHEYSNEKWTNSGGSQYTDVLLRDANGFTAFIKSAFNIFPPEVNAVIVFTFIAVGFVIILKFVRG